MQINNVYIKKEDVDKKAPYTNNLVTDTALKTKEVKKKSRFFYVYYYF